MHLSACLSALLLACAGTNAAAANSYEAKAAVSNLSYVIDLGNGVTSTPVFTVSGITGLSNYMQVPDYYVQDTTYGVAPSFVHEYDGSRSAATRDSLAGNLSVKNTVKETGVLPPYNIFLPDNDYRLSADAFTHASFWLPAHATINMSGQLSASLDQISTVPNSYWGSVVAYATLQRDYSPADNYEDTAWMQFDSYNPHRSEIDNFSFSYTNSSGEAVKMYVDLKAYAEVQVKHLDLPPAVPEPATYGMLAGGLLMLGAVARRKAKQGLMARPTLLAGPIDTSPPCA